MIPTPHLDDDGLSAVLDGQGDAAETDHARDCVECQDRLAQWDAARQLVASPVPPAPDEVRRAAIAAATRAAPWRPSPVPFIRRPRVVRSITGIAAALVIGGLVYAAGHSHPGSVKGTAAGKASSAATTTTGAANANANGQAGASGSAAGSATGGSTQFSTSSPPRGLPAFTSPRQLVAALKQQLNSSSQVAPTAGPTPTAQPACSAQAAAAAGNPRLGPILAETATYSGVAAEVYVYRHPRSDQAVVLRVSNCQVLTTANF